MYTFYTWWLLFVGTSSKCERKGWEGSLTVSETNNSFKLMKQTLKTFLSCSQNDTEPTETVINLLYEHSILMSALWIFINGIKHRSQLKLFLWVMLKRCIQFTCFISLGADLDLLLFSFSLSVHPSVHLGCITNIRPDVKTSRWQKRARGHQVSWLSDKGLC